MTANTSYRPEIDGLRAIAVGAVMLFHAGIAGFGGGFVGVDVFFVISGYLITRIIIEEQDQREFSFLGFYERRIRRILPALFLVVTASIVGGWFLLLPREMANFSESVVAVSMFVSNIWLWSDISYFDHEAHLKPLLHTWSLAVEEQFYLGYPLFLVLVRRYARARALEIVAAAAVISFGVAQWASFESPAAAFYFLPTRGWELLLGSVLALAPQRKASGAALIERAAIPRTKRAFGALIGLMAIGAATLVYDDTTPFPGAYALLPAAGCALILAHGQSYGFVHRLLSSRALVTLGLMSYSLYLWHQVLLAFVRQVSLREPTKLHLASSLLASIVLAWISWRYVERPCRDRARFKRSQVFFAAALGTVALSVTGIVGARTGGWADRVDSQVRDLERMRDDRNPRSAQCHAKEGLYIRPDQSCILGDPTRIVGALVGDSHADIVSYQLSRQLSDAGIGLRQLTYSGCPPIPGLYRADASSNHKCGEYNEDVAAYLKSNADLRYVILLARWPLYLDGTRFDNREGGIEWGPPVDIDVTAASLATPIGSEDRRRAVGVRVVGAIRGYLDAGKEVVLVYAIPEVGINVPAYLAKARWFYADTADLTTSYAVYAERNSLANAFLDSVANHPRLHRIRPATLFCMTTNGGRCAASLDGRPLYFDDNHLSSAGSRMLAAEVMKTVAPQ